MDIKAYIASGIIEDYCLGILGDEECRAVELYAQSHPEIKQEMNAFMQALEQYALDNAINPGEQLRTKIFQLLDNLTTEYEATPQHLPLLNKYSDLNTWLRIVEPLLPGALEENMFVKELRNEHGVSQTIIWTKIDYPDEVHEEVEECFIILKGKCRCYIEGETIEVDAGGFLEIPMFKHHDVTVLESPVLAVVQRVKVA
jgi:mannose-6-phosphate isomerase-like protein (cupin superfamily)